MARIATDNPKTSTALHVAAMHANFLNRSLHLHRGFVLNAPYDARPPTIWVELDLHAIADEHLYPMQTHLTGEIRKYRFLRRELNAKERIRERLFDDSFYDLCISHICADKNSSNCPGRQATQTFQAPRP